MEVTLDPGRIGVWTGLLDSLPAARAVETVAELESMGYGAVWIPETVGRDALVHAGLLLGGSERIVVATGIANVYARDAVTMANGARTLAEAYPDRFLLGVGVSHEPLVARIRGHDWGRPVTYLRRYLQAMADAPYWAHRPSADPPVCVGALGPRALALAAELTWGAHPYNVTVDHTAGARELMGPDAFLAPMAAVTVESDASRAREIGRQTLGFYLDLPNYRNSLRRQGFDDEDFVDGGSDRIVDALRPWGDVEKVAASVREHLDAGADHVCVQVMNLPGDELPLDGWRALASALVG